MAKRSSAGKLRRLRRPLSVRTLSSLDQREHGPKFVLSQMVRVLNDCAGSYDQATSCQKELASQFGLLSLAIQDASVHWLEGKNIDWSMLMAQMNCQRRCMELLGVDKRVMKDAPPLHRYLAERAEAEAAKQADAVEEAETVEVDA